MPVLDTQIEEKTLIERIEAGPGSRELSDECLLAVGWRKDDKLRDIYAPRWFAPDGTEWRHADRPDPSQNLQDAIDWMMPEEWTAWGIQSMFRKTRFSVDLSRLTECDAGGDDWAHANAPTPALALCAAALRARETMEDDDDN
jgi:hypothetical protein